MTWAAANGSTWVNAQPQYRETPAGGGLALGHNGNLVNTAELARDLDQPDLDAHDMRARIVGVANVALVGPPLSIELTVRIEVPSVLVAEPRARDEVHGVALARGLDTRMRIEHPPRERHCTKSHRRTVGVAGVAIFPDAAGFALGLG